MEFVNLVCANCGGTDFQKLSDLEYRCNHCQGLLVRTSKAQPVLPPMPPPPVWKPGPTISPNPFIIAIGAVMGIIFVIVAIVAVVQKKPATPPFQPPGKTGPLPYNVATPPPASPAKVKGEIVGKASDRFGTSYIKCMITNTGESVVFEPHVTLNLYKGDVKLDTVYGDGVVKYLKPGAATPAWVPIYKNEDYTRAEVQENGVVRGLGKPDGLFLELKYIDAAMTVEIGISSFNGQEYKEKFFDVSGTIENDRYDKIKPVIYVIYYDSKSQIVGVESANPPEVKKGEKAKFDVSAGETQLFGVPVKYEIVAIDPNRSTGACMANMIC